MRYIAIEASMVSSDEVAQCVTTYWNHPPSVEEIAHRWGVAGYPDSFLVIASDGTPFAYTHQGEVFLEEETE